MPRVDLNFDAKSVQVDYSGRYDIDVNVEDAVLQEVIDSVNNPSAVLDCIDEGYIVEYLKKEGYVVQEEG